MKNRGFVAGLHAILCGCLLLPLPAGAGEVSPWQADRGDGTYINPVLYADYSDPDAIRVGGDFYLVSSSFNAVPGIPLLHSKDLVNWNLVGHVFQQQKPVAVFRQPQHGNGVWAPCLRHHGGKYWIFYPDPDYGIYMTQAVDFRGPWSEPVLMLPGKGFIDPSPLWDTDGQAYLIHAWAKSRAGFNNILTLHKMSADGTRVLDDGIIVVDGNKLPGYTTLEGPKLYKRNGYYYIFAPAGGVKQGWQSVFRAKNIYGPYEDRIVLEQGNTAINGPHQGAWVETNSGESWFLHFQDLEAYGRVVHLQPMRWQGGWPVMGSDENGDGRGQPVTRHRKPEVGAVYPAVAPPATDLFETGALGVQWQWNANWEADWYSLTARPGYLRLNIRATEELQTSGNLWHAPFLLLQKLPAPEFQVITKLKFTPDRAGDRAGLLLYGLDYAWIGARQQRGRSELVLATCSDARGGCRENVQTLARTGRREVSLRLTIRQGALAQFAYSFDGKIFKPAGGIFQAQPGRWVGARVGVFAAGLDASSTGYADFDGFVVTAVE
jgi:beta-xylosidase